MSFQGGANDPYRFSIRFCDWHQRREWLITQPPVHYEDEGYFFDWLVELPAETREFVIAFAKLIVKAHEGIEAK